MRRATTILTITLAVTACEQKVRAPSPSQTANTEAKEASTAPPPPSAGKRPTFDTPTGWEPVASAALDETQQMQLEKAISAQGALGKTLVGALTKSVQSDGFAASIEFCRGEAPGITESVGEEHGLKIGRTSHRLRNPNNTPPKWAADAVDEQIGSRVLVAGPDGQLGVLSPITMAKLCENCHGPTDTLADGVATALAEQYPDDRATGFQAGDLRGWFWVEVPEG